MGEVIVVAHARAKEGRGAEAEALLMNLVGPTHGEEGCLLYALHRDVADPDHLVFVERWSSREALERHSKAPHLGLLTDVGPMVLTGPVDVFVLEAVPGGEPHLGTLAGG
ncbi:MAG TPA: putative quinol monooxygenase [Miltoncostaeaceae bacterium]|nr:putative quinol monooxygenase [Miltoncostaeaceae bacterium]